MSSGAQELHDDDRAQRHPTDRALGEKSESEREIKQPPPPKQTIRPNDHAAPGSAEPVAQQFVASPVPQGHEKNQPDVGDRGFGVEESLQAKGEDDRRPKASAGEPKTRPPGQNHHRGQRRGERAGQTRRERVLAKEMITGDLAPVSERRLVEAVAIIEIRHHIIAPLDHLARGLGETWFIAIDQRQRPGAREVKKQTPAEEREKIAGCRLQESDSKMAGAERQSANSRCTKSRRPGSGY